MKSDKQSEELWVEEELSTELLLEQFPCTSVSMTQMRNTAIPE